MLKRMQEMLLPALVLGVVTFASSQPSFAAGSVSVSQAGDSTFNLVAGGLNGAAGYHLILTYDSARLSNPRVALGNMAMGAALVANTTSAGTINLGVLKANGMSGNGVVVTVSFDRLADSPGAIGMTGTVIDERAANLHPSLIGWSPPEAVQQAASENGSTAAANSSSTTGNPASAQDMTQTAATTVAPSALTAAPLMRGGTLTMPSDSSGTGERREAATQPQQAQQEQKEQPVPQEPQEQPVQQEPGDNASPAPDGSQPAVVPESPAPADQVPEYHPRPVQSVLAKFRLYTGEKTPQKLAALFGSDQGAAFSQIPPVCIADGTTSVRITIPKVAGQRNPSFTYSHAGYVSLKESGDDAWQVEVRPEKGALEASVIMQIGDAQQEIPIVVAPFTDVGLLKSGAVTQADFELFLNKRGTEKAPDFDLNGDGKRDYLDDYIFTANYLAVAAKDQKSTLAQKTAP